MRPLKPLSIFVLSLALATSARAATAAPADPRTPEAIAVQVALERVCLPLLAGQTVHQVEGPAGLHQDDNGWFLALPGAERLALQPPGGVNPTVCTFSLTYPLGQSKPLLDLLTLWATDRGLKPVSAGRSSKGPTERRWTWSWQGTEAGATTALVFDTEKLLNGQPVAGALDRATILVSRTKGAPP
jgi:hypothetical protein